MVSILCYSYRLLGTKQFLHKIKLTDNPLCSFCSNEPETIVHLFVDCEETKIIWKSIQIWLKRKGSTDLILDPIKILFESMETTGPYSPINVIYIVRKFYIYKCSRSNRTPNIFQFQTYLNQVYKEQEYLSRLEARYDQFCIKWLVIQKLFSD